MGRNLASSLARRYQSDPMRRFDRLPSPLRAWLREAALPWSPASALRIWNRACRKGGPERALARLTEVEAATLARDRVSFAFDASQKRKTG
ncbi:DUF6525 family protein [Shimia sp. SDUM112013]|uniref:DUF6525 family protein n=1 Tax=Shimia sp. SDUM112013 TaxID=3136160 RepID=UPI0032EB13D5